MKETDNSKVNIIVWGNGARLAWATGRRLAGVAISLRLIWTALFLCPFLRISTNRSLFGFLMMIKGSLLIHEIAGLILYLLTRIIMNKFNICRGFRLQFGYPRSERERRVRLTDLLTSWDQYAVKCQARQLLSWDHLPLFREKQCSVYAATVLMIQHKQAQQEARAMKHLVQKPHYTRWSPF